MPNLNLVEAGEPITYSVRAAELVAKATEEIQVHGMGPVDLTNGLSELTVDRILDGPSVVDIEDDELEVLTVASFQWALDGTKKQLALVRRSVEVKDRVPEWEEVAVHTFNGVVSQMRDLSVDLDNLGGIELTRARVKDRSAGLTAVALVGSIAEDIAGSKPKNVVSVNTLMKHTGTVLTGLARAGVDGGTRHSRQETAKSIGVLEHAKINRLTSEQFNRFSAFVKILEPLGRRIVEDFDDSVRSHDFGATSVEALGLGASKLEKLIRSLSDEQVEKILTDKDLVETAIAVYSHEVRSELARTFPDVAHDLLSVANQGKIFYRGTAYTIEAGREGQEDGITSETHQSKDEVFRAYLPEIRKIAIILGGTFHDIQAVHDEAGDLLEDIYAASDQDVIEFPHFNDLYIELATRLNVGILRGANMDLNELSDSVKDALVARINEYYELCLEDQLKESANCFGVDPDIFFPGAGESLKPSRRVCAGCPEERREYCSMVSVNEYFGVWAGTSERDRKAIRRERGIAEEPEEDQESEPVTVETAEEPELPREDLAPEGLEDIDFDEELTPDFNELAETV